MTSYSIGEKVKNFRKRRGISQLQLELSINSSPGSISRIENGKVNPTKETLHKIAEVLVLDCIETAYLFDINLQNYLSKSK